jgi:hypothetical protein
MEILDSVQQCIETVMKVRVYLSVYVLALGKDCFPDLSHGQCMCSQDYPSSAVQSIGITNQRETTVYVHAAASTLHCKFVHIGVATDPFLFPNPPLRWCGIA